MPLPFVFGEEEERCGTKGGHDKSIQSCTVGPFSDPVLPKF